jgi:hypothetical protein
MTDATNICSNPECKIAETGHCHLDRDPVDSCEFYESEEIDELDPGEADEPTAATPPEVDGVLLRSNKLIPEEGITGFRNRERTQTVVLVGEQKTGKTTLLAALYGMFCKGAVGQFEFVSSQTLYSFAERFNLAIFHPSRAAPVTPRTSRGEDVNYFHLKLRAGDYTANLLISDRSGEAFEDARVDTSLVGRLTELALADRVCFLLDASRLTRVETRTRYQRIFKQMLRALIDNGALPKTAAIEVLITKLDRLSHSPDGRNLIEEVRVYEQELGMDFGGLGFDFSIHRICALPRADLSVGFVGIEELVARWASVPGDADIAPMAVENPLRQIDRLLEVWK